MVRHLTLGNGSLLVNIDSDLRLRDLYFPYAGQENHVLGKPQKIGVQGDEYTNIEDWETSPGFREDTIVTESVAENNEEGLEMRFLGAVNCDENVFLRQLEVENKRDESREVKLFFHQDFDLYGNGIGDTCFFHPEQHGIVHYKRNRYIMANVRKEEGSCEDHSGYGIYREKPEPGDLNMKNIAQGDVNSIISVKLELQPYETQRLYYWLNTGQDLDEVTELSQRVEQSVEKFLEETEMCWRGYLGKLDVDSPIPERFEDGLKRSLLVIRSETNNNGAITAANDSENLQFNKDTYGYVWPRDGAFVAEAMAEVGYHDLIKPFYDLMEEKISEEGYLLHKYNPDGSLGSSWHPWIKHGEKQLPIQEDETALVIWSLNLYSEETENKNILESKWNTLIKPAAEFMINHFDEDRGLPEPSYDLWEEKRYISTFTVASVYAALKSAEEIAKKIGKNGEKYGKYAEIIKQEGLKKLRSEETIRYGRGIDDGELIDEVSAPLLFLEKFGLTDTEDEYFQNTVNAIRYDLSPDTEIGGIARYRGDTYHASTDNFEEVPGNPWIICTLWLAQHFIKNSETKEELEKAENLIEWTLDNSLETGLLPEQVDPYTGNPKSVSPLTWSHSTYITTVKMYAEKCSELKS